MQLVRTAALLLFAFALPAQTFRGSISGVVTDASGAAVVGAAVKLDNPATGISRAAASNSQGEYLFADLPVSYRVEPAGFFVKQAPEADGSGGREGSPP